MKAELAEKWGDPSKYQRRTRETTTKMAEIAMEKLKDFTNTINFILKQNNVQNVKNILRKKFKVYKPVSKPQKISKTI